MTSLTASFPTGLNIALARLATLIAREREIMRIGLARRAAYRKNYCVLRNLNEAELAELGIDAKDIPR